MIKRLLIICCLTLSTLCAHATPDLIVPLEQTVLKTLTLNIDIKRANDKDKIASIKITSKNTQYEIPKKILDLVWAPELQGIILSESISLKQKDKPEKYQMYIKFALYSIDGSEPPEEQKLEDYVLKLYFDNRSLLNAHITKNGKLHNEFSSES